MFSPRVFDFDRGYGRSREQFSITDKESLQTQAVAIVSSVSSQCDFSECTSRAQFNRSLWIRPFPASENCIARVIYPANAQAEVRYARKPTRASIGRKAIRSDTVRNSKVTSKKF